MNKTQIKESFNIAKQISDDIKGIQTISLDEEVPTTFITSDVIENSLFENTRGYYLKLVYQINTTYKNSCYDACALLTRKLIELMIEEIYESDGRVKDITYLENGQLFGLGQLISTLEADDNWKLNRNVEEGLNIIKAQGDKSAHNRRYNARKSDIDKLKPYLRDISEELLYLAQLLK